MEEWEVERGGGGEESRIVEVRERESEGQRR